MKQRRVLVTGAGGFVGRALSLGFADLGWQVIGLDRAFDAGWESAGCSSTTGTNTSASTARQVIMHIATPNSTEWCCQ